MTRSTDDDGPRSGRSFGDAARNFQEAAEDFAASAADQASERAAEFLDDAAARLRGEHATDAGAAAPAGTRGRSGRGRHRHRHHYGYEDGHTYRRRDAAGLPRRSRRLYRDVARRRIAGVCAGIANYFGVETWVTRCIAVTGLIFVGQVTLPAYLVAWIVMERAPLPGEPSRRRRGGAAEPEAPRPETGVGFSPRGRLRALQADATELELRLRRMETHVTSGQYELQRELREMEAN